MKIQIQFRNGKEPLTYEADSIAEAVRQAIKNKDELRYADLSHADLRYANLAGANLTYADLRYANLAWANLTRADLRYANLAGANLTHADLSYTDLRYANLAGANLRYANLTHADLNDASLHRADLRYAKVQDKILHGKRPFLSIGACGSANRTTLAFFFEYGSEPFIMCGCFKGGLKEFKARIKETHSGTFYEIEYNAMVNYIKALYKEQQQQQEK